MKTVGEHLRSGVAIGPERTITDAAILMEQAGVGSLAVVDDGHRLLGIVTDRDLVRRAMARRLPDDARVDSVMSSPVVTIDAGSDVHDACAAFRSSSLRRLAVTRDDVFAGMLSVDDLLVELTADLADLGRPLRSQIRGAQHDSPVPSLR